MQQICFLVLALTSLFGIGCSSSPDADKIFARNFDTRLRKLALLYSTFQVRNNWAGPADENEFRTYINGITDRRLERLEISKSEIDDLFVSERDGQPYRVRWKIAGGNGIPPRPILFETDGFDGKYMVGFTNGSSQEFSKEDSDRLWIGSGDDGSISGFSPTDGSRAGR